MLPTSFPTAPPHHNPDSSLRIHLSDSTERPRSKSMPRLEKPVSVSSAETGNHLLRPKAKRPVYGRYCFVNLTAVILLKVMPYD